MLYEHMINTGRLYDNRTIINTGTITGTSWDFRDLDIFKTIDLNKIKKVEFYPPATKLILKDGRDFVSVAQEGDEFDKEQGVKECLLKFLFDGNSYYPLVRSLIRENKEEEEAKEKKIAEEKAAKEAQIKREKENREKRIAREKAQREYEIEVQKEAYLRAMREMKETNKEESNC